MLYSGTPCQIAALKLYLRKDYENLLAIDIICHGAPSPGVFRWYLSEEIAQEAARQSGEKIQFRSLLKTALQGDNRRREKYSFSLLYT